jgi:hypothetical protein
VRSRAYVFVNLTAVQMVDLDDQPYPSVETIKDFMSCIGVDADNCLFVGTIDECTAEQLDELKSRLVATGAYLLNHTIEGGIPVDITT